MSEKAKEITVKVKYDPDKNDTIEVKINPNAKVSELEEKVKETLGKLNNVPMGILKFNREELDNKDKTLKELGIKNNSEIKNENRVLIRYITGKTIYITCDENTTVREFLKQLKNKDSERSYIRLIYASESLQRSTLDQKLLGCRIGKSSINRGATLCLAVPVEENGSDVFNLNNLEESKDSNYPPLRIIVGIADLLLLAAAVATFLLYFLTTLSLSVVVPIVLAALFVVGAILFFGWDKVLPKILPDDWLKEPDLQTDIGENVYDKIKKIEYEKDDPGEENKDEKEEEEEEEKEESDLLQ